ncbi:TPA: hypothetical protein OT027_003695 [Klebsiella quasipneumoniae]|uniref:hypothetical protein n=1 Tax=Klebsiella pneumoniae complex TaxID=3390273 RepID=UPI0013309F9C|nr:hypothetical protein [Klebsiella pneumoniae]MCF0418395.1 hypothetical protein [Klebsiella pneumoniae]MDG0783994.1 hypothetical protein [Klebsiella pneumoniae]HCT5344303.1 hypothetical protein [Klebsiella quasipneumoniae]
MLGWAYDPHLTEQRLSLNLAELDSEMTMTIAHSGNHLFHRQQKKRALPQHH